MKQPLKNHKSKHTYYTQIPTCFDSGEEFLQGTPLPNMAMSQPEEVNTR